MEVAGLHQGRRQPVRRAERQAGAVRNVLHGPRTGRDGIDHVQAAEKRLAGEGAGGVGGVGHAGKCNAAGGVRRHFARAWSGHRPGRLMPG
jgi:hypothetical protein